MSANPTTSTTPANPNTNTNTNTNANANAVGNTALAPLPSTQRSFGFTDHAALWFSLGVGLLVMQIGAYLEIGRAHV